MLDCSNDALLLNAFNRLGSCNALQVRIGSEPLVGQVVRRIQDVGIENYIPPNFGLRQAFYQEVQHKAQARH
jgi:hypothetical protein